MNASVGTQLNRHCTEYVKIRPSMGTKRVPCGKWAGVCRRGHIKLVLKEAAYGTVRRQMNLRARNGFVRNPIENRFRGAFFRSCINMNCHSFVSSLEQARDDSAELAKAGVWFLPRRERRGSQSRRKASPEDFCDKHSLLLPLNGGLLLPLINL